MRAGCELRLVWAAARSLANSTGRGPNQWPLGFIGLVAIQDASSMPLVVSAQSRASFLKDLAVDGSACRDSLKP